MTPLTAEYSCYTDRMKLDISALLQKAGLKVTEPRVRLLKTLANEKVPASVTTITKKLRGVMNTVTVYRSLESLSDAGIVARTDFRHGHAEYELNRGVHHHHLVCTTCGTVEDVPQCDASMLEKQALTQSKAFTHVSSHALEFFGVCKRCVV